MPRISIVMNCYNGARYLREAINSVQAQRFEDWELIFWDNASTDDSAQIALSFADPRIRYFRGERTVPLGEARKLAMEMVTGEWIGFLDTDDLWYPDKLSRQIEALDGSHHVLCYSAVDEVAPNGSVIRRVQPGCTTGHIFERQLIHFDINMVSPLIRRETLSLHGLTFNPMITASEEYNLFLRTIVHGTVCVIHEPLAAIRVAPGTLTDRQISKWAEERFLTLDQLEAENPGITERYSRAFHIARARGQYYRARYLMSLGRRRDARQALRPVVGVDPAYLVMLMLTHVPPLWTLAHSTILKRKILPRLWSIVAPK